MTCEDFELEDDEFEELVESDISPTLSISPSVFQSCLLILYCLIAYPFRTLTGVLLLLLMMTFGSIVSAVSVDAEKKINALFGGCVTDDSNPQLSRCQKLLLRFHYKLGHCGFQHLKVIIKQFKLFGAQGMMAADKDAEAPPCSSCISGGLQCLPTAKGQNKTTQDHKKRGIFRKEKLLRGELIFSDQFVSLTEKDRNYNEKDQQRSNLNYIGGTIFVDAATSYISLRYQVSFTGGETAKSMLDFEHEAHALVLILRGTIQIMESIPVNKFYNN